MREPKPFLPVFLVLAWACEPASPSAPPPTAPATVVPVASASAAPLAVEPAPTPSRPSEPNDGDPVSVSHSEPPDGPPPTPPGSGPPFDRGRAASTLGAVNVQSCATASGPRGSGRVKLTFGGADGRVRAVAVEPPYAGTAVGSCILARFRAASVPPFAGADVTVAKSFVVQ